jgi:hypothetical protein
VAAMSVRVVAQDVEQRTRDLAAALDKTKYKKKEKANVSVEMYVEVRNEPVARANVSENGGVYESEDSSYRLDLHVEPGGVATGSGYDALLDGGLRLTFQLRDGRIDGALLTATKVYENGETRKFDALFVNRTVATGRNANDIASRETKFGLGFIQYGFPPRANGDSANGWTSRVFLEKK